MAKKIEADTTSPKEAVRDIIKVALEGYVDKIKPLGIVSEIIVARGSDIPGARLFNVTTEDFSEVRTSNPLYHKLHEEGGILEDSLEDVIDLFVDDVNPSQLGEFLEACSTRKYELRRVPIEKPSPPVA